MVLFILQIHFAESYLMFITGYIRIKLLNPTASLQMLRIIKNLNNNELPLHVLGVRCDIHDFQVGTEQLCIHILLENLRTVTTVTNKR